MQKKVLIISCCVVILVAASIIVANAKTIFGNSKLGEQLNETYLTQTPYAYVNGQCITKEEVDRRLLIMRHNREMHKFEALNNATYTQEQKDAMIEEITIPTFEDALNAAVRQIVLCMEADRLGIETTKQEAEGAVVRNEEAFYAIAKNESAIDPNGGLTAFAQEYIQLYESVMETLDMTKEEYRAYQIEGMQKYMQMNKLSKLFYENSGKEMSEQLWQEHIAYEEELISKAEIRYVQE